VVNAAYGTKHYHVLMVSDGMDNFVMAEKIVKTTPGAAGLQSVATSTSLDFSIVASKPSPFAKNASRRGEHWQAHSEKDCS
jgi:hypothetical protein